MFIIAQILGFIAAIINICSIQLKKKKDIIIWLGIVNLLFTICFIFLNAYSGAIICFILFLQTIISYIYEIKNKKLPKIFIPIYIIVPTICGFIFYKSYEDILPIICSISYTLSIIQTKEKYIRSMTLVNIIFWIIYDLIVGAYTAVLSNIFFIISTIIAIVRYDILKVAENKNNKFSEDPEKYNN